MAYSQEIVDQIEDLGHRYIQECLNNTRPHVAGSGKVVDVPDRHIPTIDYFLRIWIPLQIGMELINRRTWYRWLDEEGAKCLTIKNVDNQFKALATDIVGNEGKGIFYAKNRLGMHDRQQVETRNVDNFDFDE
jgi:hypothetical protein